MSTFYVLALHFVLLDPLHFTSFWGLRLTVPSPVSSWDGGTVALTVFLLCRAVEEGLTYKFHAAWSSVLQLLGVFFEACGKQAHPVMKKVSWGLLGPGHWWHLGPWSEDS